MYERGLKAMNPTLKNITYDVSDLFNYIDSLWELCCLVFRRPSNTYIPHNKEWIKSRVLEHLRRQSEI